MRRISAASVALIILVSLGGSASGDTNTSQAGNERADDIRVETRARNLLPELSDQVSPDSYYDVETSTAVVRVFKDASIADLKTQYETADLKVLPSQYSHSDLEEFRTALPELVRQSGSAAGGHYDPIADMYVYQSTLDRSDAAMLLPDLPYEYEQDSSLAGDEAGFTTTRPHTRAGLA